MPNGIKEYWVGIDLLKIVAAFTVVLIHSPNPQAARSWDLSLHILPPPNAVFALIAGMLMGRLLTANFAFGNWLKRRAGRLVVPYLIWTAIYVATNLLFDYLRHFILMTITEWRWWLSVLLAGRGCGHLWFVAMLLSVSK